MHLSQKPKLFSEFLFAFSKCRFKKKMTVIADVF